MALTFTKKAASEMKERIAMMIGERNARKIPMGTFHSIFIRFLREYAELIGYPSTFTIYDTSDSISAIKACLKEMKLDDKVYKPKDVLARISAAKNNLTTAEAYAANPTVVANDRAARKPELGRIYLRYAQMCRQSGVMDFDDILLNMNILLRDHPDALKSIADRFDYLLVDEYQDTNMSQYLILRKLSQFHHNLCVVGDDSQSIYAFRGARIENILRFQKDFPGSHVFRLERNYRSTQTIVNAANSLIANNEGRIPKNCVAVGEEGEKIRLIRAYTEQEEALLIASAIIERLRTDRAEYQDFAILYRTNSQSRAIEEALRKRNLPYMIYSGNSFFERAEVKDMMAFLKLAVNPNDDESFKRIVNKPARGISDATVAAIERAARDNGTSLFHASMHSDLTQYGLKKAAIDHVQAFCKMMDTYAMRAQKDDAHEVARSLALDSGYYLYYKNDNSVEAQARAANIEELLNSAVSFREQRQDDYIAELIEDGTISDPSQVPASDLPKVLLGDFLEDISLLSNVDVEEGDSSNMIALMTAHSAKGLEFPYVFVAGMEENLFPSGSMLASEQDIEEERRLFYVAMTRAKKAVTFTFATTRMRNGKHENNSPSRFLREIAPQYIENPLRKEDFSRDTGDDDTPGFRFGSRGFSRPVATSSRTSQSRSAYSSRPKAVPVTKPQTPITKLDAIRRPLPPKIDDASFIPATMGEFKEGQRIEHNRFGKGRIVSLTGSIPDIKAKVQFDNYGEKLLLLKYAKMRIL